MPRFTIFPSSICFQTYMAPWLAVFIDPVDQESAMYNNFRLFGTGLLCIMGMTTEQLYTNDVYYYNYYDYMSIAQVQSYLSASSLSINSRLSPWPVSYSPSSRCTSAFLTISTETINYGKCRRHFMVAKRNGGAYAKRIKEYCACGPLVLVLTTSCFLFLFVFITGCACWANGSSRTSIRPTVRKRLVDHFTTCTVTARRLAAARTTTSVRICNCFVLQSVFSFCILLRKSVLKLLC